MYEIQIIITTILVTGWLFIFFNAVKRMIELRDYLWIEALVLLVVIPLFIFLVNK